MKTKLSSLIITLFFLIITSNALALSFENYLPTQQGWSWEYQSTVDASTASYSISGTKNINGIDTIIYDQNPMGDIYITNDNNGFLVHGADNTIFTPSPVIIAGPNFSIGDSFSNTFEIDFPEIGIRNLTVQTTIVGFEFVSVTGYSGDALKINLLHINNTKESETNGLWRHTEEAWFAEGIGLVKTTNNTVNNDFILGFNMELQSYNAVPIPSTISLLAIGLLGMAGIRRKA